MFGAWDLHLMHGEDSVRHDRGCTSFTIPRKRLWLESRWACQLVGDGTRPRRGESAILLRALAQLENVGKRGSISSMVRERSTPEIL
jgi:hypothetical protein